MESIFIYAVYHYSRPPTKYHPHNVGTFKIKPFDFVYNDNIHRCGIRPTMEA